MKIYPEGTGKANLSVYDAECSREIPAGHIRKEAVVSNMLSTHFQFMSNI